MNRCLAFLISLMFASLMVASASTAQQPDWLRFTLDSRSDGQVHATFQMPDERRRRAHDNSWSSSFSPPQLVGLDVASFRAAGSRPLRFALIREAGRLDCAGNGGRGVGDGNCRFTPDAGFMDLLHSRGIGRPTREQAFGLMALDVRRDIIDAVAAARYPAPRIDDLMAMTAVGVTGAYIRGLAQAGYRPRSVGTLVEFKALNITPEWIGGFARNGYASMDPDELVQLRALNITADYIAGFERLGYRNLPVSKLVELKALGITPEFVRSVQRQDGALPPVGDLVERKIFGRRP